MQMRSEDSAWYRWLVAQVKSTAGGKVSSEEASACEPSGQRTAPHTDEINGQFTIQVARGTGNVGNGWQVFQRGCINGSIGS